MFKFIIISVFPVLFLLFYLYRQDQVKPEPKKKLLACFGLGMAGGLVGGLIIDMFAWMGIGSDYDSIMFMGVIASAVTAAVFVSVCYVILWQHSIRNKDFDEFFDGPVYSTCIVFGYLVMCDLFNIFSDEWAQLGLVSIMVFVVGYGAALFIGYYYSLAYFGKMELSGSNKFKMWLYPFLIIFVYNVLVTWFNSSILGNIVGYLAFGGFIYFLILKNKELLGYLRAQDAESESSRFPEDDGASQM